MNASEKRIHEILGDDLDVSPNNFRRYRAYLKKSMTFPVRVTGNQDFPWEEPYVMGGWDEEEYEELKKMRVVAVNDGGWVEIIDGWWACCA